MHPNCIALFAFDNSTNHQAKAQDALIINKLKLTDGFPKKGNNTQTEILRDGWYYNRQGERIVQQMANSQGNQKGIQTILTERETYGQKE